MQSTVSYSLQFYGIMLKADRYYTKALFLTLRVMTTSLERNLMSLMLFLCLIVSYG